MKQKPLRLRHLSQLNDRIANYVNGDYHDALLIGMTAKRRLRELVDFSVIALHSTSDAVMPVDYYFAYRIDDVFYWSKNISASCAPIFFEMKKKDYKAVLRLCVTLPHDALQHGVQMYVVRPGLAAFVVPICRNKEVTEWDRPERKENSHHGKRSEEKKDVKSKKSKKRG